MREFVKISQTIWKSKKFKSLPNDDAKYCYLYLLTCPHSNSAGCFDLSPDYISTDMKWDRDRCLAALDTLCDAALIQFDSDENTVMIEKWCEFNSPANPKHAVGMLSQLKQVSSEKLKYICGTQIKDEVSRKKFDKEQMVRAALASFFDCITYSIPLDGDKTETETETRPRLDKTETREEVSRPAPRSALALGPSELALEGVGETVKTPLAQGPPSKALIELVTRKAS